MAHAFWLAIAAGLAASAAGTATADEVYICDTNRAVRVPPGMLETMMRTDPCIAAHHGLKVTEAMKPAHPLAGGTLPGKAIEVTEAAPKVELRPPIAPEIEALPPPAESGQELTQDVSAKPSDFRNVRLLNGGGKTGTWYRHQQ